MHSKNGLLDACRAGLAKPIEVVDGALRDWLISLERVEPVALMGHSVHFDLAFAKLHLPVFTGSGLLTHQLVDTGAFARFMRNSGITEVGKPHMPHRAMDDCYIELEEARAIQQYLTRLHAEHTSVVPAPKNG
jgi:oligoribonuclease (3'-5' exoribonuclease)